MRRLTRVKMSLHDLLQFSFGMIVIKWRTLRIEKDSTKTFVQDSNKGCIIGNKIYIITKLYQ